MRIPTCCSSFAIVLAFACIPAWAVDGALGVPNFHQVDRQVYRGGQPAAIGWQSLAQLGVKTVIDLRPPGEHSTEAERQAVMAAGMTYLNVPMNGLHAPSDAQVSRVLAVLNTPSAGPVFIHCRRGADRTGTIIACYRMSHANWPNQRAIHEAKSFGMSRFEIGMRHYLSRYHPAAGQLAANVIAAN